MVSIRSDNVSLSDKAAEQIIQYIQENRMERGDKLPNESKLMEQLNVSRSTIREAVRSLSSRGIVVVKQGSGTYIDGQPGVSADPLGLEFQYDKAKALQDLLEIRVMIEPESAALCAKRASDKEAQEILKLGRKIQQCIRTGVDHRDWDIAFHCKIADTTGNDILKILLPEVVKGIRIFQELLNGRIPSSVGSEHVAIGEAIAAHDPEAARAAMLAHLDTQRIAMEEINRSHSV